MSLALASRVEVLKERAALLAKVRAFFALREVLEVDCPALSCFPSIDAHIDLLESVVLGRKMYLHSSPEYGMKRLLSEGVGDIYQLSHVFRADEVGAVHCPEFMMIEWYRMGFSLEKLIEETVLLASLFIDLSDEPPETLTYDEAFKKYASVSSEASENYFLNVLDERDIALSLQQKKGGREALQNAVWALVVEPNLGRRRFTVITDFPKEQAALARLSSRGTALRFELYAHGLELANGYFELTDPVEQKKRFLQGNQKREALGKKTLPLDPTFLKALERGIPDCSGVAMGFDRLMMLKMGAPRIDEVLPFNERGQAGHSDI